MIRFRDRPSILPLPTWTLIASVALFGIVAVLASVYVVVPGDDGISRFVQRVPGLPQEVVADSSNLLGDPLTSSFVVLGLLVLCAVRRFMQGSVFCITVLVCWVVGASLKLVFDSARPTTGEALVRDDHFVGVGFPSGHALTVTMFACAVGLVLPALFRVTPVISVCIGLAWMWAAVCIFSRVWLGAHWFTDVVGGFALGIALIWLSAWVARRDRFARHDAPTMDSDEVPAWLRRLQS